METQTNTLIAAESTEKMEETKTVDVRLNVPEDVHKAVVRQQAQLILDTGEKVTIPTLYVAVIKQALGME